ncbi:B-box zinc finger protein 32-like [Selaginella moellendorffii]|uniref:B-box zinc finger protein 32-like n=1 Tax=Selaginella moellendorffii TaxID=88036 RepID=UPI000D1CFD2D|nr:B-box zinc finger protein 32-like [Selaginella moellendorffii]|eukprot:XP_024522753.1 B-box zinc finger protein 32-like [Selaginella moellendorffii]
MEKSRDCELCQVRAAVYCCADEAYLCWKCDSKVHGANFIVARHLRSILCGRCHSPTAVLAESSPPGPCSSLCPTCACPASLGDISEDSIHSQHSSTMDHDLAAEEEVSSAAPKRARSSELRTRSRSPSPDSVIPVSRKRKNAAIDAAVIPTQQLVTLGRLECVLRNWEGALGLEPSDHRVSLAMQLLRRIAVSIKVNRLPKLDARAALAVCLWISLKLERDRLSRSIPRVDLFGRCTGIAADVLLTVEARLCDELSTPRVFF